MSVLVPGQEKSLAGCHIVHHQEGGWRRGRGTQERQVGEERSTGEVGHSEQIKSKGNQLINKIK